MPVAELSDNAPGHHSAPSGRQIHDSTRQACSQVMRQTWQTLQLAPLQAASLIRPYQSTLVSVALYVIPDRLRSKYLEVFLAGVLNPAMRAVFSSVTSGLWS